MMSGRKCPQCGDHWHPVANHPNPDGPCFECVKPGDHHLSIGDANGRVHCTCGQKFQYAPTLFQHIVDNESVVFDE